MRKIVFFILIVRYSMLSAGILIEAEHFSDKGGWLVDPQFVEQMGSS